MSVLAAVTGTAARAGEPRSAYQESGQASWYGREFAGRRTASGEVFDPTALTAAHASLPFGSIVEVTNLENGRLIVARINDRGPFCKGRMLDCSHAVANTLGFLTAGLARVHIRIVELGNAPLPLPPPVQGPELPAERRAVLAASTASVWRLGNALAAARPASATTEPRRCSSYCVQIGAYREPANAKLMLQKASLIDMPAFLHHSRRLVHVLVGPYADRARAGQIQTRLAGTGMHGFVRLFEDR